MTLYCHQSNRSLVRPSCWERLANKQYITCTYSKLISTEAGKRSNASGYRQVSSRTVTGAGVGSTHISGIPYYLPGRTQHKSVIAREREREFLARGEVMNWQKHYLTYIHIHLALCFTAAPRLGKSTLYRDHRPLLGMKAEAGHRVLCTETTDHSTLLGMKAEVGHRVLCTETTDHSTLLGMKAEAGHRGLCTETTAPCWG